MTSTSGTRPAGNPLRRIAGGIERGVVASPDGRFLAWAVEIDSRTPDPSGRKWYQIASRVRLYDVAGERVVDRLPGFADLAAVAGFLPDGKTLLTLGGGFGDATVRLLDVESGKELRSFAVVAPKVGRGASRRRQGLGGHALLHDPAGRALARREDSGDRPRLGGEPQRESRRARPPLGRGDG